MWGELRRAVRELAPVVVNAPGQPRLESYVTHLQDKRLLLSPIATEGLPSTIENVNVHCQTAEPFLLGDGTLQLGNGVGTFHLDRVRLSHPPSRRGHARLRVAQPRVLVMSGLSQLDVQVFPVLDISAHGCAIETYEPLVAGETVEVVELWGDRRLLRRCSAVIADTIPWRDPDGARRYRVRVLFTEAATTPRHRDQVEDPQRIGRILQLCAFSAASIQAQLPLSHQVVTGRFLSAANGKVQLSFDEPVDAERIRVRFDLYAISYEMQVRILSRTQTTVETAFPLLLQRRRRRYQFRATVPRDQDVRIGFVNPATGETYHHDIVDLSFGGVAFRSDPASDVLWSGLTLESVTIRHEHGEAKLGEASVVEASDDICRAEFRTAESVESPSFVDLMARLRYPRLEVSDGSDFEAMVRLYKSVGLFGPHMKRNLTPESRLLVARNWRAMHQTPLCRTLVQRERGEPVAGVSALRAWENAWVIQHMVAARNLEHYEPGVLHMSYLDYVLPRPDGQYMVVFVNTGNSRIVRFLSSFFSLTGTPEAVTRKRFDLWIARGTTPHSHVTSPFRIRAARRSDHALICNAAQRTFGKVSAAALSVRPETLKLPSTERAFAKHGLLRSRRVRVVTEKGIPHLALLEERASPGINLTWLLNCGWILPLQNDLRDDVLQYAARELGSSPTDTPTGDRFVMVPRDIQTQELQGFEHEAGVDLYAYNRTGLHRWYYFLREHYGQRAAHTAKQDFQQDAG